MLTKYLKFSIFFTMSISFYSHAHYREPFPYFSAYYANATKERPIKLYKNMADSVKNEDAKTKITCTISKRTLLSIRQEEKSYGNFMPLEGKCKDKFGWVNLKKISKEVTYYTFNAQDKINISSLKLRYKIKNVAVLPKFYERVAEFNKAPGNISISIQNDYDYPSHFRVSVYKKYISLHYKIHAYKKLGSWPCGCVTFVMRTYYRNKFYYSKGHKTGKFEKRIYVKEESYYSREGNLTGLEPLDSSYARTQYIIRNPKLVSDHLKIVSSNDGNSGPKDKVLEIRHYNRKNKLLKKVKITAHEYWAMLYMPVQL